MTQPSPRWTTAAELSQVDVPPGGTTDQVLAKNSNADRDLKWADAGGGGGGADILDENTAFVRPGGSDETGEIGTRSKPFLTEQAAIDAFVDAMATFGVIDIGANAFNEDLTIDDAINIEFIGVARHFTPPSGEAISQAFSSLTLTAAAMVGLTNCRVGDIFTSQDLTVHLKNAQTNDIISTNSGGVLNIISIGNDSEATTINGGNVSTLTVVGMRPADIGFDTIEMDEANGGTIVITNCNQQSGYTGLFDVEAAAATITATNSLLHDVTADQAIFIDSRANGSISLNFPVTYQDVLLNPANMDFQFLPTSDPEIVGRMWNDAGTLTISEGPPP